jgi:dTDP-4-amino-4,6-dideoxygalactose transaminase
VSNHSTINVGKIPFLDLKLPAADIHDEIQLAIEDITRTARFALGPYVEAFETAFAEVTGTKHCVGVNSGTSALHLAMICAGVGAGDEVITVPMTFVATSWAIRYVGARPVFVDVDPETCTMDVEQIEAAITPRTKAILPVHLYGQPADLDPIKEIAERHGLVLIEDAAQAHAATYQGRPAGSFGLMGCFSFYPGKNLGAFGEAGAVVTSDQAIAKRLRALRDHAQTKRYHHQELGFNYRMDALQGAVLKTKLRKLRAKTKKRQRVAARYQQHLSHLPLELPIEAANRQSAWHLYVVRHPRRDHICEYLSNYGVQTGLHYPIPLHLQKAFADLGYQPGDFPVSEQIANECFSLPMFPELTGPQQRSVVDGLVSYFFENPDLKIIHNSTAAMT